MLNRKSCAAFDLQDAAATFSAIFFAFVVILPLESPPCAPFPFSLP